MITTEISAQEVSIPSIQLFKDAVEGKVHYDSKHPEIQHWEDVLVMWVLDDEMENRDAHIAVLFETFRDIFSYSGTIWKGMWRKDNALLRPVALSSFTDEYEVALYFVGASHTYGYFRNEIEEGLEQVMIQVEAHRALALDELLDCVCGFTKNVDLMDAVDRSLWEREKLYPLTEQDLAQCELIERNKSR